MLTVAVSIAGALLFLWPLLGIAAAPYLPALAAICGAVILIGAVEGGMRRLDSRGVALLAVIAAIDSALRMAVVNGIAGFSPVFFLILCVGYVFGPVFGFLCGSSALLASAVVTGGIGPWLPYQMLAAGWCGAAAGLAGAPRRGRAVGWTDVTILATVGMITGFAFGALLDIWDWTLRAGDPAIGWVPGLAPAEELGRFARFYLLTSLAWDSFRAVGNAIVIVVAGRPILLALHRLHRRMVVDVDPPEVPAGEPLAAV